MRIITVCSQDWINGEKIKDELVKLPPGTTVACGTSATNRLVLRIAEELKFEIEEWEIIPEDGARAWAIRNQALVESGADLCVAFPAEGCRETWDFIKRSRGAQIDTIVVR